MQPATLISFQHPVRCWWALVWLQFLALWMASVLWWTAFRCCVTASRQPMLSLQLAGLLYACLFLALLLHESAAQGAQGW
jgi:hypothetical protein